MGPRSERTCADMGWATACGPCRLGHRECSPWGHEACERMTKWAGRRPVDPASGAVGAAPRGTTKRVKGMPKYARRRPWKPAAGTFFGVEVSMGPRDPGRRHVDLAAGTSDEFLMGHGTFEGRADMGWAAH
eukprot:6359422-Pyramimonas_sp.AAC.1